MKDYKIITYQEAIKVIEEIGLLPLADLLPEYPSLNSMTSKESWHSDTEFDPWTWRTKFAADGVAAYGKFLKKKSILISRELLPCVRAVLGRQDSVNDRYKNGLISKEAMNLYHLIKENEGIDTRILRAEAGMKNKEKKKAFDQALVELQGTLDITISGIKEKQDANGEKNGWSSTSFETMSHWMEKNDVAMDWNLDNAKEKLRSHFSRVCTPESLKKVEKFFML
ncbi:MULTISPECIES: hypothetical protein [unclassified Bacillus (in: firmicutes)]|uniref:AlkZ-related protein n=1 Tax=unclassified Bacillus (in: firmicutes) TaxID=185979 RepID=UPI0008E40AA5|nr:MULTISPECIES: hypothetical protein [unclassified Bacillus (in: firmicutes)]SFA85579.1 hypothetical protein SAMN02799634_10240 [Bacillus sp. UNCCL13]SFQ83470.1 hypothetical protein SAMN04488577_2159 [Bacillus sp. cl95]